MSSANSSFNSVTGIILIDNYEELVNTRDSSAIAPVVSCLHDFFSDYDSVIFQNEPGRFIFFISHDDLRCIIKKRFALLDSVRDIPTPSSTSVTVSIAVGIGEGIKTSFESARQAIELAQGRGGDQAVVNQGRDFHFYGGKQKAGERYSRVKSRVISHALAQLMKPHESVFIMGHKVADFDSFGSALGIAACAMAMEKKVSLVLEHENDLIAEMLSRIKEDGNYSEIFISPEEALKRCSKDSLLVIVDTQIAASTPAPDLLEQAGSVAVIDHHRRGVSAIKFAALQNIQVHASSASELVCELIQYFKPDVKVNPILCSALLSGIAVDTKHYSVNTGVRTFEAAAFLRKHGADADIIQSLFKDDTEHYIERSDIIKRSEFIKPGIVISSVDETKYNPVLLAAQSADQLVRMRDVSAAFIMVKTESGMNVSARSNGDINVQLVLEILGGGGHYNSAGVQLPMQSFQELREKIVAAVELYLQENS